MSVNTSSMSMATSMQQSQHEMDESELEHGDIVQDAQLFQDAALEYQMAYQSLEDKYTHQAILMKEASEALQASESCISAMQEELMALKHNCEADIQRAIGNAVSRYKHQLSSMQSRTHDHQSAITQLQEQVQALKVSLASQRDLPSVGASQGEVDLREEVFTLSQGQSIQTGAPLCIIHLTNHFNFRNRSNSGTGLISLIWSQMLLVVRGPQSASSHVPPYASTPFCGSSGTIKSYL